MTSIRELQTIVEAWEALQQRGEKAALATVVSVEGSAYRRCGARMLISSDGTTWGGISGGCLEADVVLQAQESMAKNSPTVTCYDTRSEVDRFFGLGMGCNGVIHILIEPLSPGDLSLAFLSQFLKGRETVVLASIFRSSERNLPVGAHYFLRAGEFQSRSPSHEMARDLRRVLNSGVSETRIYQGEHGAIEVLLEVLNPAPSLVIFGAGHDALPVVRIAKELGWRVVVADNRSALATSERFPLADAVIATSAEKAIERAAIDEHTGVLMMTHNYPHDIDLLPLLLASPAPYIGLLGSRRRSEHLMRDVEKMGWALTDEERARLYAPVGLDIGAETPEEIALAAIAEMKAVFAQRQGGSLRERGHPIHEAIAQHSIFESSGSNG